MRLRVCNWKLESKITIKEIHRNLLSVLGITLESVEDYVRKFIGIIRAKIRPSGWTPDWLRFSCSNCSPQQRQLAVQFVVSLCNCRDRVCHRESRDCTRSVEISVFHSSLSSPRRVTVTLDAVSSPPSFSPRDLSARGSRRSSCDRGATETRWPLPRPPRCSTSSWAETETFCPTRSPKSSTGRTPRWARHPVLNVYPLKTFTCFFAQNFSSAPLLTLYFDENIFFYSLSPLELKTRMIKDNYECEKSFTSRYKCQGLIVSFIRFL